MAPHYCIGLALLAAVFVAGVSSRPSHNESRPPVTNEETVNESDIPNEERSLIYDEEPGANQENGSARDIIEKIKAINDGLKTPKKRKPVNYNAYPHSDGGYVLDNQILEKLQQIIAAGKLNPLSLSHKYQESNSLVNEELGASRNARNLQYALPQYSLDIPQALAVTPYVANIPVAYMPLTNIVQAYNSDVNAVTTDSASLTRQRPSLPFNIRWPLANVFPILIKDPLLTFLGGGNFGNLIEVGQNADVCSRRQKNLEENENVEDFNKNNIKLLDENIIAPVSNSRQGRALKKQPTHTKSISNSIHGTSKGKKVLTRKVTTKKPLKHTYTEEPDETKTNDSNESLRFPFGDFTWFGNRKPVAPSPGFFINRLKVRKGGVAIAGPGGVATAGRGGTAIVGPGGLAYTQPGSLAVAGPAARIVALSSESDLSSIVSRLQEHTENGSVPRSISQLIEAVPEGKVVATGPIIFYHPNEQTFFRGGWRFGGDYGLRSGYNRRSDEYHYNGMSFVKGPWMAEDAFILYLKPVAHATSSPGGVAVANPISNVVVARNEYGSIVHAPVASAVVGPYGIAHAQSDLYLYEFYTN